MWGDTAALRACAKFHRTLSFKRHLLPKAHGGSGLGRRRGSPQLQEQRKDIVPDVLRDSRLKCARVHRDLRRALTFMRGLEQPSGPLNEARKVLFLSSFYRRYN